MKLTFGDRLMLLRKKQKVTAEQLSIRMTVPIQKINDWENDISKPSLLQAIKLADLLDTSLDFLTCRINAQPNKQFIEWASEIDQLSEKSRKAIFYTITAVVNVDKMDRIYGSNTPEKQIS